MGNMTYIAAMDDKLVTVRAFLPPELRNSFKSLCVKKGITMNDVIVEFIKDYVNQEESNGQSKVSHQ